MTHKQKDQGKRQEPDPEVIPIQKAKRRKFSAKYKLRLLKEYERCTELGEKGASSRREGLYSSNITTWRRTGIALRPLWGKSPCY